MASLKPAFSKALFHSRMPSVTAWRYFSGTLRSTQKVMGSFGAETAAAGSFFSRRQRLTKWVRSLGEVSSVKSTREVTKWPTRSSARRGRIGSAGSFAKLYWKVTKKLRGSGEAAGGAGIGTGDGVSGGGESFARAKCARTCTPVSPSVLVRRARLVLRPSSAKGRR